MNALLFQNPACYNAVTDLVADSEEVVVSSFTPKPLLGSLALFLADVAAAVVQVSSSRLKRHIKAGYKKGKEIAFRPFTGRKINNRVVAGLPGHAAVTSKAEFPDKSQTKILI